MLLRTITIALLLSLIATAGHTHSKMSKSIPANGSTAQPGLPEITLGFAKPVRLILVKMTETSNKIEIKPNFKPAAKFGTTFPVKVEPLQAGDYEVNWTAIAKDGHVMKGSLNFKVAE